MEAADLVSNFESLGDNCEFGLVQRRCGAEPLGFFRWNYANLESLVRVLGNELADLGTTATMEIAPNDSSREWIVRFPEYGFTYHTHRFEHTVPLDAIRSQQIKVLEFEKRKLLGDLRSGEKIFLRKGIDTNQLSDAMRLYTLLRRRGPNTLLWVVPEDEIHPRGTVEVIGAGLLKGYIDRYAPMTMAVDISPVWLDVCRHAFALWKGACAIGTRITANHTRTATNLLRREHLENGLGWSGVWKAPTAISQPVTALAPPNLTEGRVLHHRLTTDTTYQTGAILGYTIPHGLVSGVTYVASMYVYIPQDADLDCADVIAVGYPAGERVNCDLTLRNVWQRIWTAFRIPHNVTRAIPSIYVVGRAGTSILSAAWQLELGYSPSAYVSSEAGQLEKQSVSAGS